MLGTKTVLIFLQWTFICDADKTITAYELRILICGHTSQDVSECIRCYFVLYWQQSDVSSAMYRINDQTVLEEEYDENYQPTDEGPYLCVM